MLTHMVSIYDRKTKSYDKIMTMRYIDRVEEEFDAVCKNEQSSYYKHPEDYEVHLLGTFNDSPHHDPELVSAFLAQPKVIATGKPHANS